MSYLDVFKKKLTVFADEMVIKGNDNVVRRKNVGWSNAPGNWMEG